VQQNSFERLGTFEKATLLGGDAATRDPRRQLFARWLDMGVRIAPQWLSRLRITEPQRQVWQQQWTRKINCIFAHSVGRMFDCVAAGIGLGHDVTYEAQAAIRVESLAQRATGFATNRTDFEWHVCEQMCTIDFTPFFRQLHDDLASRSASQWAIDFHEQLARASVHLARHAREVSGSRNVVLAGGVMVNSVLLSRLHTRLVDANFAVFCARNLPPNDGAISVGQAYIAGQMAIDERIAITKK
jgi:hydrogenase maturation protein HypF